MNKNFINKIEIDKYKQFAFKEDMLKMCIAFMLGTSFNKVVQGISEFIIMPFVNFIIMQTGNSWRKWKISPLYNLEIEIGQFLGVLIDFILISIILYVIYHKIILGLNNYIKHKEEPKRSADPEENEPSHELEKVNNVKHRRNRKQNKRKKNTRSNKKRPNG